MKCEKCGLNNATAYIKKVIDGKVTELHLCSECAAKDYKAMTHNPFADILSGILGGEVPVGADKTTRCPGCGASLADISRSGKMGCGKCYAVFKDQLMPSIKRIHGKTKHVGKVPPNAPADVRNAARMQELREQLQDAIQNEEFEKAALLRDSIKEMEGEGKQ